MRSYFFGKDASTSWNEKRLKESIGNYKHYAVDIRNFEELERIFKEYNHDIELVVHTAAQPSHDWVAQEPLTDFSVNAGGGRFSNCSMKEAIALCEEITGKKMNITYSETNRIGDHIWYISDLSKFKAHYPDWHWKYDLKTTAVEIFDSMTKRI
jgi:UDP-glucose 4-epimerase